MYIPPAFHETDPTSLHDFIEAHSFGVLVSPTEAAPFATHLPFLLDRSSGQYGTLVGHLARVNPHGEIGRDRPALVVFNGPHAYVSPTWYESPHVVPTWNYVAVHATGRLELVENTAELLEIVKRSVLHYEQNLPTPWILPETEPFVERLVKQIVGVRIVIERLDGKWKLNQNHSEERRRKVADELEKRGGENAMAIASLMRRTDRRTSV